MSSRPAPAEAVVEQRVLDRIATVEFDEALARSDGQNVLNHIIGHACGLAWEADARRLGHLERLFTRGLLSRLELGCSSSNCCKCGQRNAEVSTFPLQVQNGQIGQTFERIFANTVDAVFGQIELSKLYQIFERVLLNRN